MIITIGEKQLDVPQGTSVIDLIEGDKFQYQAARINNRIRELNYVIPGDAKVELLTLKIENAGAVGMGGWHIVY